MRLKCLFLSFFCIGCVPSNYYHLKGMLPSDASPETFKIVPYSKDSLISKSDTTCDVYYLKKKKGIANHKLSFNDDEDFELTWLSDFFVDEIVLYENGIIYQKISFSYETQCQEIKKINAFVYNEILRDSFEVPVEGTKNITIDLRNTR